MKNNFTSMAFLTIRPIMDAIYAHPFIVELIDGTLERGRFLYYLHQDSLYLVEYARALALAGTKMTAVEDFGLMLYFADQALVAERELHDYYFKEYNVAPVSDKGPACLAYTNHLLERAAVGSGAEGMAALLPCFWIYREAANHVRNMADVSNPYFKWIINYSDEAYSEVVNKAVDLTDRLAAHANEEEHERMFHAFITSSRYEYSFWDDSYTMRTWPLA